MSSGFDVRGSVDDVVKNLPELGRQVKFATALAITWTAQDLKNISAKNLITRIDRPTPFTQRGFYMVKATKRRLSATVGYKDIQAKYLAFQEYGGTRTPQGGAAIPVNARVNKYGNIPGMRNWSKIEKLVAKPDHFRGIINGVDGIWQRRKGRNRGRLKLIIRIWDKVNYRERLHFTDNADQWTRRKFPKNFNRAALRALSTAK